MPGIPLLETDRLLLRPLTGADFDALHEIHARGFGDGSGYGTDEALAESRKVLGWIELNEWFPRLRWWNTRLIVLKATGQPVGEIAFVPVPFPLNSIMAGEETDSAQVAQRMELSMVWGVLPESRGNGYAAEAAKAMIDFAFKKFNLERIIADTEHENTASQAVMRKIGMTLYKNRLTGLDWIETVGVLVNPQFG
jgi:RimJ/RimL family protein N-acetyltransferase